MLFSALMLSLVLPFSFLSNLWQQFSFSAPHSIKPPSVVYPTFKPERWSRPTSTPLPTSTPTPVPTLRPTSTPTPVSPTYDAKTMYFLEQINNYRKSQGLSAVKPDPLTCNFAKVRAQEISTSFNHDGFNNRINSKTLPYPSYSYITENLAMNSNYQAVVNQWINSPGHAANMRADTSYACVQSSGNYYAYEGWKP